MHSPVCTLGKLMKRHDLMLGWRRSASGAQRLDSSGRNGFDETSTRQPMKIQHLMALVILSLATVPGARAAVLAGPITNAANAHIYYLLSTNTWTASEAEAVGLGGHLVTINDAAENQWVQNTFFPWTGDAGLWIGLNDAANEGQFVWASGEPVTFIYWYPGEPNNLGGEDYAAIRRPGEVPPTGSWNDTSGLVHPTAPMFGVVELQAPTP